MPDLSRSELLTADTARRLAEVGVLDPRRVLAGATVLPWLAGRGPSLGVISQLHATATPRRPALVDRWGRLTWLDLEQRVNRAARGLRDAGVGADDVVALVLRNGRELVETILACQKLGAVAAPLNTWAKRGELEAVLRRAEPAALVYDVRNVGELRDAVPDGTALWHVGDGGGLDGSTAYEQALASQRGLPLAPVTGERGSNRILIHTSGTTGTPKAASRRTGTEGAGALLGVIRRVPYRRDDVVYIPTPGFHAFGLLTISLASLLGATMVLPDKFDPRRALEDLAEHRVTAASFVPVMVNRMLDLDDPPDVDLSALRILLVSGSAMSTTTRRRTLERFGDVLYDLYGSTEAGWVAIATPEAIAAAPDAVGEPVPGVEIAFVDEDGGEAPPGEVGEIVIRQGATFEGYRSGEETDVKAGGLAIGDLGYLDEDGYLHVVGRADDMVVVGGENVYPSEVEDVIAALDAVDDVAVLGADDDEMGQVLVAFVVGDVDPDEVRAAAGERLPSFKTPRRVEVVEELPRTATGKVLKRDLRERVGDADAD